MSLQMINLLVRPNIQTIMGRDDELRTYSVVASTNTVTSAAFTPPNNSLLVLVGGGQNWNNSAGSGGWNVISSSPSLTWTHRVGALGFDNNNVRGLGIWTAPVTTGVSTTVTVTTQFADITANFFDVYAFTGYNVSDPVGGTASQRFYDTSGIGTWTPTGTLSSTPALTSVVMAFCMAFHNSADTITTAGYGAGFTGLYTLQNENGGFYDNIEMGQWRTANTSTSVGFGQINMNAGAFDRWGGFAAIEIKQA